MALALALCMTLSLCACGGGQSASSGGGASSSSGSGGSDGVITVKYAVTFPGNGTQSDGAEKMKELIEQYSEGRMQVEIYYSVEATQSVRDNFAAKGSQGQADLYNLLMEAKG